MKLGEYSTTQAINIISSNQGIKLEIGPFTIRIRSYNKLFIKTFHDLYLNFSIAPESHIVDFHIDLLPTNSYRRWVKPQINFSIDGHKPFSPFSASHAMPLFEWGFNWCIVRNSHQYLMLHAAVLEKNQHCLILPAAPGSGKSTLAAALAHRNWRFLSDEFCLVRHIDGKIVPIPRPTPLKNDSIQLIRDFAPESFIGPLFENTRKGTIGHLRAPISSTEQQFQTGKPKWIIFPNYQSQSEVALTPLKRSLALLKLATNSFNYELQGETGFKLAAEMVNNCDCYDLAYSRLEELIPKLDQMAENA